MAIEIDLLKNYPKTKRNTSARSFEKNPEDIKIARRFDKEFFDGDRKTGYGGYQYNEKYWTTVVKDISKFYNLNSKSKVLDVGCAKGFMVFDMINYLNNENIYGIDISEYAIDNGKQEIIENLYVGQAHDIKFPDNFFDLAISITTIHNYDIDGVKSCLKELNRVSKKSFITVDAYRNEEEKKQMFEWNLTAKTILHVDEWISLFKEVGFNGDYYWFMP